MDLGTTTCRFVAKLFKHSFNFIVILSLKGGDRGCVRSLARTFC